MDVAQAGVCNGQIIDSFVRRLWMAAKLTKSFLKTWPTSIDKEFCNSELNIHA